MIIEIGHELASTIAAVAPLVFGAVALWITLR